MWRRCSISTDEGDQLVYWQRGSSERPIAIVLPGLIGQLQPLDDLCEMLSEDHQVVCLNHRGLYGAPAHQNAQYSVECWHRDVDALVRHVDARDILWLGWSAGGRIAVEAAKRHESKSRAVVAIAGTFGRPFEQRLQTLIKPGSSVFRMISEFQAALKPGLKSPRWLPELVRSTFTGTILRLTGITAETTTSNQINELVAHTLDNDLHALVGMWRGVSRHCAQPWRQELSIPSLWFSAERDVLTPVTAMRAAARGPGAELMVVPGASHLLTLDQPELIRLKTQDFLRRVSVQAQ